MKRIILENFNGLRTSFDLSEIDFIRYGHFNDLGASADDMIANDYSLNEPLLVIYFKDHTKSTFGRNWIIRFV